MKLSKFPTKYMKKSDEINGIKVILKDFIKVRNATSCDFHNTNFFFTILQNSQVLTVSDVSPGNPLRDWLLNDGRFFGFINPSNTSWTPLVLAFHKKKEKQTKLALCVNVLSVYIVELKVILFAGSVWSHRSLKEMKKD